MSNFTWESQPVGGTFDRIEKPVKEIKWQENKNGYSVSLNQNIYNIDDENVL